MKAWTLHGIGQLEYADAPVPKRKEGWVLVRVEAAGVCGSDIPRIFQTGTYHFPTIPGHEFAGRAIEAHGKDAAWMGKRVGVFPLIPCKECDPCQSGQYEMCRNYDYLGSRRDGGFAELVSVPAWNLMELPDAVQMEEAAMFEPAAVALHAIRRISISPETTVALFGLGTIGLLVTQWLRIFGVRRVFAVGHNPGHGAKMQETASEAYAYLNAGDEGADAVSWIMEHTGGRGADAAIECAGSDETLSGCIECVKPGGQILMIGNPKGDMKLDQATYWKLLRRQIRLTGTWNSSFFHSKEDDWHKTAAACAEGKLRLSELITHRLAPADLMQGLLLAKDRLEYHNKIMVCNERQTGMGQEGL